MSRTINRGWPGFFRFLADVIILLGVLLCTDEHCAMAYNGGTSWRNDRAFAALRQDGRVFAWGLSSYGGSIPSDVSREPDGLIDVKAIFSTFAAFAALKGDGRVVAWGDTRYGGEVPAGLSNVKMIYSVYGAFAALKEDGKVVAWGDSSRGSNRVPADLELKRYVNVQPVHPALQRGLNFFRV